MTVTSVVKSSSFFDQRDLQQECTSAVSNIFSWIKSCKNNFMYWIILWYVHQQIPNYDRHSTVYRFKRKIICLISLLFSGMKVHAQYHCSKHEVWQLNSRNDVSVQQLNHWLVGTCWITSQHDSAVLCHMIVGIQFALWLR
jgi:hypothetical protein